LEGVLDPVRGGHGPLDFMSEAHVFNMAGHAAVGCASAVASGGKCGPGALSGAASSFATPLTEGAGFLGGLVITSTAGGLASVAGGGKFGNGALTAAYEYLFNHTANLLNDDAGGGHNIERHVGKRIEYLEERLQNSPNLRAASTFLSLDEANAVVQMVFDNREQQIDAWLADPKKGDRLILTLSHPITSRDYFPIGLVLDRGASIPLPGNGVLVVLDRAPLLPNGFRVTTSYPTLTLPNPTIIIPKKY